MSQLFASGGQSIGVSASMSVLPMNIQDWFPLGWTDLISLQSKELSRVFSDTIVQKRQFFSTQLSLTLLSMTNLDSILKSRDITLPTKFPLVKVMVFPVAMWELDYKETWALKNWYFWTVVLEKTLESPLDCKEIKPANPKGNQSWILIGRTDAEAEAPILWPPDVKN